MALIVSSHQPHFFPWLGYLDKMAKSDMFMLNDIVQPIDKSGLVRNKILSACGKEQYINISIVNKGLTDIIIKDVLISDMPGTRNRVLGRLTSAYRYAPYFKEIYPKIEETLSVDYERVIDLDMATINLLRELFDISTHIVYHSDMGLTDLTFNKSENLIKKSRSLNADIYLSGNGARKYIEPEKFKENGLTLVFQDFTYPEYIQKNSDVFVPNLSSVDILFNCGTEEARRIFWENVRKTKEFEAVL